MHRMVRESGTTCHHCIEKQSIFELPAPRASIREQMIDEPALTAVELPLVSVDGASPTPKLLVMAGVNG
jgi:hypothetical protein